MKKQTWIILGSAVLAVLVFYALFAYAPMAKKLHRQRQILALKEKELGEARSLVSQYAEFQERSARTQMIIQRLEDRVPARPRVPELIKDITRVATECNLKELQFTPQPPVQRKGYWEQPIKISAACSYHTLGAFLIKLANLPRLITAQNVKLTGKDKTGKSESVFAELTLVTYVQQTH
jgi:type IV pilus assembly protein PilO